MPTNSVPFDFIYDLLYMRYTSNIFGFGKITIIFKNACEPCDDKYIILQFNIANMAMHL